MARKDFHPKILKTNIPKIIFDLLGIQEDEFDFSEDTPSGGGSTVTKQAWSKMLKEIEGLKSKGVI